jgi:hypothetical protein
MAQANGLGSVGGNDSEALMERRKGEQTISSLQDFAFGLRFCPRALPWASLGQAFSLQAIKRFLEPFSPHERQSVAVTIIALASGKSS